MTSRQPICEVGDDGRAVPLFHELLTSIGALRQTLMPDQNLFSDRWLFQYLTGKLDQRMVAWLSTNDDSTLPHCFSLNNTIDGNSTRLKPSQNCATRMQYPT